jgi:hypothetical protein
MLDENPEEQISEAKATHGLIGVIAGVSLPLYLRGGFFAACSAAPHNIQMFFRFRATNFK